MADIKSNAKSIRGRITAMEISAPPRIGLPMGDGSYIYVCCSSNEDCDRLWDWVQDITNTMNELDAMVDNWDEEIKKLEAERATLRTSVEALRDEARDKYRTMTKPHQAPDPESRMLGTASDAYQKVLDLMDKEES